LGSSVFNVYGADPNAYQNVLNNLPASVHTVDSLATPASPSGYISSPQSRTIWVQVTAGNFNDLFGSSAVLRKDPTLGYFWTGNLTLPAGVAGLWFDNYNNVQTVLPNGSAGPPATLSTGIQGVGNGAGPTALVPQTIAQLYNFPLAGLNVDTGPLALVEPVMGNLPPSGSATPTLATLLGQYRAQIGLDPAVTVDGVQPGGSGIGDESERSLDLGVATAVNPNSTLILYAGSGTNLGANSEPFTAYQSAIFDPNHASVVSSSFRFNDAEPSPGSPWMYAARQLMIDAALANISMFSSAGDGGSGYEIANGLDNVSTTRASPFSVIVGGTSLSLEPYAANDPSLLASYLAPALAGNLAILWQLAAGGLTALPTAGTAQWFAEAVWNRYDVKKLYDSPKDPGTMNPGYLQNESGNGGVDTTQATPWFQAALLPFNPPTTTDGSNATGRGVPDVSALSSGNMAYTVPSPTMIGTNSSGGTSAATPFWASLTLQIDRIFRDQGLPQLGYMTDLLYIAAAVAPASFNDVSLGSNVSSFLNGSPSGSGPYNTDGSNIDPTGFGYYAGPGYDLGSGLGSPDGTVLARTLSAIGHQQMSFGTSPDLLDSTNQKDWTSGAEQQVLVQAMSSADATISVAAGRGSSTLQSMATASYAWTARFAEQVLQPFFDQALVRMFDKNAQGSLSDLTLRGGEAVSVSIDGQAANGAMTQLTSPFGIGDFQTLQGDVRFARPVAVAETAGGQNDQNAIVRLRGDGEDTLDIRFYRVDDFEGTVAGKRPGDAGYADAVASSVYTTKDGQTWIGGPGYGNFEQTELVHVNAGDLVAMELRNDTHNNTYFGFSQANETVDGQKVAHLWNYGLNTWGFEDTYGGGDRDYNDLVVGLDFTSASGHGWLK
jgi:hypothetical protein